jgi:hypothetical protein
LVGGQGDFVTSLGSCQQSAVSFQPFYTHLLRKVYNVP